MIIPGVIASSSINNYKSSVGGQNYSGTNVAGATPIIAPGSSVAVTVQNLFVVGNSATWTPVPGYSYNIKTYNADGTLAATYVQSGALSQLGIASVPTGGTAVVQAVANVSGVTTYSVPTAPDLSHLVFVW